MVKEGNSESIEETYTYNSGLFCVSITTAIGILKFNTGPHKSISASVRINRPYLLLAARSKDLLTHARISGAVPEQLGGEHTC
jgi:hypothetical protein